MSRGTQKAKIMSMQNVEKGRLLEVAAKLYLQEQGFKTYFWSEWASQKGLPLQDTGIDLVAEINGELYAVQCKNWDRAVFWKDVGTFTQGTQGQSYTLGLPQRMQREREISCQNSRTLLKSSFRTQKPCYLLMGGSVRVMKALWVHQR
jgi:hypothetical protein